MLPPALCPGYQRGHAAGSRFRTCNFGSLSMFPRRPLYCCKVSGLLGRSESMDSGNWAFKETERDDEPYRALRRDTRSRCNFVLEFRNDTLCEGMFISDRHGYCSRLQSFPPRYYLRSGATLRFLLLTIALCGPIKATVGSQLCCPGSPFPIVTPVAGYNRLTRPRGRLLHYGMAPASPQVYTLALARVHGGCMGDCRRRGVKGRSWCHYCPFREDEL